MMTDRELVERLREWTSHNGGQESAQYTRPIQVGDVIEAADTITRLLEEVERLRVALAFYADRDSYRQFSVAIQRRRLGGKDPVVSRSDIHNGSAPHGFALSDVQLDNYGDRARAALSSEQEVK